MQVICTDGTVLQCQRFEAIDSGVLLFEDQQRGEASNEEDEDETERDEEATAFVPLHQLRFVLPDGVQPGRSNAQSMGQTTPQPTSQAPPTGGAPPRGQTPPQQSMGGQSSAQQRGTGQPPSRPDPNRR